MDSNQKQERATIYTALKNGVDIEEQQNEFFDKTLPYVKDIVKELEKLVVVTPGFKEDFNRFITKILVSNLSDKSVLVLSKSDEDALKPTTGIWDNECEPFAQTEVFDFSKDK